MSIVFAPHIPAALLGVLIGIAVLFVTYGFVIGARGTWARGLAFLALILALANPLMVRENREPLKDVAAIVVDHSQSMGIGSRKADADKAAAALKDRLKKEQNLDVRLVTVTTNPAGEDTGTQLFAALNTALADVQPERVAGAFLVTDGEVHDIPAKAKQGPVHAIIVGTRGENDRKLTVSDASRYAIVGQNASVVVRIDDLGGGQGGLARLAVRIDGADAGSRDIVLGRNTPIEIPITHEGESVVELEATPGPHELTLENNRAVVTINGVRDRLRVLLVSGEPNAGERVWRSLLKGDPSVDLVHFTILRDPEKIEPAPMDELALIEFPKRELFQEKLDGFDLIIFDRYGERGILPLGYYQNLSGYVYEGGALLVSAGPEFSTYTSIYRTPLSVVLPAQPTGEVIEKPFKPMVTALGQAHPITKDLPGANTDKTPPSWGRWFRQIGAQKVMGDVVMSGPGDKPLLVLDRIGKGRVAELLSDQGWLWARGFEGGGPIAELLRRIAHWSMKEPELEEERLTAAIANGDLVVERRTMANQPPPVTVTKPDGSKVPLPLAKAEAGLWRGRLKADALGLYRVNDGTLSAVAAAGALNPKEVADMRATDRLLAPVVEQSGGGVAWFSDGMPEIRRTAKSRRMAGDGWMGIAANQTSRVTSVDETPLLPAWLALLVLVGTLMLAWRQEGR
ncbi:hypothetical protein [Rhizomicrobium electricum]|jgi:hypothetical protein|uniref:Glutamine amidotransferase domain-containing protein n=1 Tax=Rhizomicrobium electricum TaxID=480070 RepID=A0ABP3PVY0_9PROT|nr:hypothetical protein [Rhizomicrobium electricum]NIJ49582.1 hypothetical protein [Rhizomicrobium electricum]